MWEKSRKGCNYITSARFAGVAIQNILSLCLTANISLFTVAKRANETTIHFTGKYGLREGDESAWSASANTIEGGMPCDHADARNPILCLPFDVSKESDE